MHVLLFTLKEAAMKGNFLPESGQFKSWTLNADIFARNVNHKPELMYQGHQLKGKYAELKRRYKFRKIWNNASGINNSTGEIEPSVRDTLYGQHPGLQAEMENPDGFPFFNGMDAIEGKGSTPTYENQEDWSKVAADLLAAHESRKKKQGRSKGAASLVDVAIAKSAVSKLEAVRNSRYAGKESPVLPLRSSSSPRESRRRRGGGRLQLNSDSGRSP
jgi:hypothetical protein